MNDNYILISYSEIGFVITSFSKDDLVKYFSELHKMSDQIERSALASEIKNWMDLNPEYNIKGGWGHRIIHGHSFSDVTTVFNNHGPEGVLEWSKEISYDFLSPHGLPLPFANEIRTNLGLNIHQSIDWLCINFFDSLSATITVGALFHKLEHTLPSTLLLKSISTGLVHLIHGNPIGFIASGAGVILAVVGIVSGEEKILIKHSNVDFTTFNSTIDFNNFPNNNFDTFNN